MTRGSKSSGRFKKPADAKMFTMRSRVNNLLLKERDPPCVNDVLVVITSYHHDNFDTSNSEEIKQMLQKKIEEKEKEVRLIYLTRGM